MTATGGVRPAWVLHPYTAALVLVVLAAGGVLAVVAGTPGAAPLLVAVAGAAAGFANSGST